MADGNISQITLPNGSIYDIEDTTARGMDLVATYTAATFDLELSFSTPTNADNEEF
jgi:hypothetical protein